MVELAILWLNGEECDGDRLGYACIIIEGYLAHGAFEQIKKIKAERKAEKQGAGAPGQIINLVRK